MPEKEKTQSKSGQEFYMQDNKVPTERVREHCQCSNCKEPASLDKLLSSAKAGAKPAREEDDNHDEEEDSTAGSSSKNLRPLNSGKVTCYMAERNHTNMQTAEAQTLINSNAIAAN